MKSVSTSGKRSRKRRGILTFEWILLISLLVIGVIGGLTAVRNSLICELNDLTNCIEQIACCDDDGVQPAALGAAGYGQSGQAGCATCNAGGNSSGDWWSNYGDL
jgi:hypothetical protein